MNLSRTLQNHQKRLYNIPRVTALRRCHHSMKLQKYYRLYTKLLPTGIHQETTKFTYKNTGQYLAHYNRLTVTVTTMRISVIVTNGYIIPRLENVKLPHIDIPCYVAQGSECYFPWLTVLSRLTRFSFKGSGICDRHFRLTSAINNFLHYKSINKMH